MRAVPSRAGLAALLLVGSIAPYVTMTRAQAQTVDPESPLTVVKRGICDTDETFAVAIHGGAMFWRSDQGRKVAFVQQALSEAGPLLASGAQAIDVVEAVIVTMENSGLFNAGKGATANQAGVIEMDASIMEGLYLKAGAVASVKAVRNPISAARLVMDKSPHVMMVGPDADRFVQKNDGAVADAAYFLHGGQNFSDVPLPEDFQITPPDVRIAPDQAAFSGSWAGVWVGSLNHVLVVERIDPDAAQVVHALGPDNDRGHSFYERLIAQFVDGALRLTDARGDWIFSYRLNPDDTLTATAHRTYGAEAYETTFRRVRDPGANDRGGTVGAVARDRCGNLAAGTSTGGFGSKTPGRVGDTPIIGAGTYANNETAAISATGHGEFFMRHVVAYAITAAMKYKGVSLAEAATDLVKRELFRKGLRGGVIAVDRDGNIATPYNTEGMVRGITSNKLAPMVEVY